MRYITGDELRQLALRRGPLYAAVMRGKNAALRRFKLAGPMGADVGVAPRGEEQSHGTGLIPYAPRDPSAPDGQVPNMSDWLWQLSEPDKPAPGRADGTFGEEVIG